jgi:hypothetical protein
MYFMDQAIDNILEESDVLCVYGIPEGSLYAKLETWLFGIKEQRYLVFIEEEQERFLQAKQHPLMQDPRVRLFFRTSTLCYQIAWEFLFLKMGYLANGEKKAEAFFKELQEFQRGVELVAADWSDLGERIFRNVLRNLPLFSVVAGGDSLKDSLKGVPAIVCGAGPSLDETLPFLAELKDRALIIGGGTAIPALNRQGIIPHIAAAIDPAPPYQRFMNHTIFETPFFYQSRFSSELLSFVHGPRLWMAGTGNYPIEEWLETSLGIPTRRCNSGWSVATFCVFLAVHLGCDPIILAGMDFSCSADVIYASGIKGEEHQQKLSPCSTEKVSKADWLMSADWVAAYRATHPHKQWINISQGMELTGIDKCTLAETAREHLTKTYDIDAHLFSALASSSRFNVESLHIHALLLQTRKSFKEALSSIDQLLSLWQRHFPVSPMEDPEYKRIDQELTQEPSYLYFLSPLWLMWQYPILRTENHPHAQEIHRLLFLKNVSEKSQIAEGLIESL